MHQVHQYLDEFYNCFLEIVNIELRIGLGYVPIENSIQSSFLKDG